MNVLRPLIVVVLLLAVNGCALKPRETVSRDMDAAQVMAMIDANARAIHDFSGSALVNVSHSGQTENFKLSIKYRSPDQFRVLVKVFAGISVGVITVHGDSLTVYFPSENSYVTASRGDDVLRHLIPGIDFDFSMISSVVTGGLPPEEDRDSYRKTIESMGKKAILTLARDRISRHYTIEGRKMNVVAEDAYDGDTLLWEKTSVGFRSYDGIMFPRKMSLKNGRGTVDLEYSGCKFNTGLSESDVMFAVPANAVRLRLPGK